MSNPNPFRPADLLPLVESPIATEKPRIPRIDPRIAFTAPAQDDSAGVTQQWVASTHIYPAAWPRSHVRSARSDVYQPNLPSTSARGPLPSDKAAAKAEQKRRREEDLTSFINLSGGPDKEGQIQRMEELRDGCDLAFHSQRISEARSAKEQQLWMSVSRIVPCSLDREPLTSSAANDIREGVTLILGHANGFHKEIFEPALHALINKLISSDVKSKYRIDEIWSFDTTHSGHAASINRDVLGDTISWPDHARDIIQFVEHFLPDNSSTISPNSWLPTFLPRQKASHPGNQKRRFIALGHSFGGAALTYVLHARPSLLEGLLLVDPAILELDEQKMIFRDLPTPEHPLPYDIPLVRGAVVRLDAFSSMPDARTYFESKPFFQSWDPRVLDLHLRFGLRAESVPTGEALLADNLGDNELKRTALELNNTKWHEAAAFAATWMSRMGRKGLVSGNYSAWIGLLSMKGGFDNKALCHDVDQLPKGISYVVEGNHLVAQEDPQTMAEYLVKILEAQAGPRTLKEAKLHAQVQPSRL